MSVVVQPADCRKILQEVKLGLEVWWTHSRTQSTMEIIIMDLYSAFRSEDTEALGKRGGVVAHSFNCPPPCMADMHLANALVLCLL